MNPTTFKTSVDIPATKRTPLIALLNAHVATLLALYSQTKQAHWNVKGSDFIQLHELFDEIASDVLEHLDDTAERAVQLGGVALGTVKIAAREAKLPPYPLEAVDGSRAPGSAERTLRALREPGAVGHHRSERA